MSAIDVVIDLDLGRVRTASREITGERQRSRDAERDRAVYDSLVLISSGFFTRDVCNLPGRDRGRCRNFSQRAESENEFSFFLLENRENTLFFETVGQKS